MNKNEVLIKAKERFRQCRQNGSGGSNAPGELALAKYPRMLRELSEDISTVVVCGTNGKTTTVGMTVAMLEAAGVPCFSNSTGANIDAGICTAFVLNTDDNGIGVKKTAVIECDEKFLDMICREIKPQVIVITNISEDQKDRLGTVGDVTGMFFDCIKKTDAIVCINQKCPLSVELMKKLKGKKTVLYSGETGKIVCNGAEYPVELSVPGRYNYANAAAASAGAMAWLNAAGDVGCAGIGKMLLSLRSYMPPFGRMETFFANKTNITINLVKNKVSADETLFYIDSLKKDFKVVFGFNCNPEDGHDTTWIDNIDFHAYNSLLTDTIVFGDASDKVTQILAREGVVPVPCGSFENLYEQITADEKPVFMLLNYTCMMNVRKCLADVGYVKNFWER